MTGEFCQKIRDILKRRYQYYYYDPTCHNIAAAEIAAVCVEALTRVDECAPKPEKPAFVTLKGTNVSITIRTDQIIGIVLWPADKYSSASIVLRLGSGVAEQICYATTPEARDAYESVRRAVGLRDAWEW